MIGEGQRAVALGTTGSGKSILNGYYFASYAGQRLLIDVGDAYELGPDARASSSSARGEPGKLDFSKRTLRYVPGQLDADEYEALYRLIWQEAAKRPLLVWLDEAEGPTTAQRSPIHLRLALKQGRKRGLTHLSSTQRPRDVEKSIITESEHAFVFRLSDPDDIAFLARRVNVAPGELASTLAELPAHGFLYHRSGGPAAVFDPLDRDRLAVIRRHVRMP